MSSKQESTSLPTPEELEPKVKHLQKVIQELDKMLLGRTHLHRMVMVGILSQGHILLEGFPGVGKTALVQALSQILELPFKRVQFTPDLMPSDIVGTHILQETSNGKRELIFQRGPIFTNLLLADEINRASPKTQSAMLEAMQEHAVTLMGQTHSLPRPFFVLASQNPVELEGTYPLPEAQLDRFLFKLDVTKVDIDVLEEILTSRRQGKMPAPSWSLSAKELEDCFAIFEKIFLPKPVARYIARLIAATHPTSPEATEEIRDLVAYGASPRSAIALAEAARAYAMMEGRPSVGFEDAKHVTHAVLNHRIVLNYKAKLNKRTTHHIVSQLLASLDELQLNLPQDIQVAS